MMLRETMSLRKGTTRERENEQNERKVAGINRNGKR